LEEKKKPSINYKSVDQRKALDESKLMESISDFE